MFQKALFILAACLVLAACAPAATVTPIDASISLTDGLGRGVNLAGPAQRVVSLAAANTEVLFAIGAGSQVVGRDYFSDYPPEATALPDIGGSMGEYNLEAIASLQPDLVLAGGINPPELVATLEGLGLTVYFLPNPATLEEMYMRLETVALLTGHQAEAVPLVEGLRNRVAAVDQKIMPLSYRPTVYYELDASSITAPYTAGAGSFVDMLIQRAGGFNAGASLKDEWATISLEELLVQDPTIIILGDSEYGETLETVAARPGWNALTAVETGQVYPFDYRLVSLPGPRWVNGLEALARLLHPGVFE